MFSVPSKVYILGMRIDDISLSEILGFIQKTIHSNQKVIIAYVNIHAINLCQEDIQFREFINDSDLVFCDGHGVRLGAMLTGQKLNYRFTPPDWIDNLCTLAVDNKWKLFFLGSKPGVAELAGEHLRKKHVGIEIQTYHGYFDHFRKENKNITSMINSSGARILLVGMGMPLQEYWIRENYQVLSNINVFLPVGAMFDYVAKTIPRGPIWMTDSGFEWLARLVLEPKRLWKRYIIGIPRFFIRLLITSSIKKLSRYL